MGTVTVQDPDDADVIVCTFLNPYADNLILLSFDEVRRRYGRDAAEVRLEPRITRQTTRVSCA